MGIAKVQSGPSKSRRIDRTKTAQTAPPQPATLRIAILNEGGARIRVVEIPDPRIRFCQTFNEDSIFDGMRAELLDLPPANEREGEHVVILVDEDGESEEIHRGRGTTAFLRGFLKEQLPPGVALTIRGA